MLSISMKRNRAWRRRSPPWPATWAASRGTRISGRGGWRERRRAGRDTSRATSERRRKHCYRPGDWRLTMTIWPEHWLPPKRTCGATTINGWRLRAPTPRSSTRSMRLSGPGKSARTKRPMWWTRSLRRWPEAAVLAMRRTSRPASTASTRCSHAGVVAYASSATTSALSIPIPSMATHIANLLSAEKRDSVRRVTRSLRR